MKLGSAVYWMGVKWPWGAFQVQPGGQRSKTDSVCYQSITRGSG